MKNKLWIAYYTDSSGERNACNYVGIDGTLKEFMQYAREQEWFIDEKEADIDIYGVEKESDKNGREYKIIVQ